MLVVYTKISWTLSAQFCSPSSVIFLFQVDYETKIEAGELPDKVSHHWSCPSCSFKTTVFLWTNSLYARYLIIYISKSLSTRLHPASPSNSCKLTHGFAVLAVSHLLRVGLGSEQRHPQVVRKGKSLYPLRQINCTRAMYKGNNSLTVRVIWSFYMRKRRVAKARF